MPALAAAAVEEDDDEEDDEDVAEAAVAVVEAVAVVVLGGVVTADAGVTDWEEVVSGLRLGVLTSSVPPPAPPAPVPAPAAAGIIASGDRSDECTANDTRGAPPPLTLPLPAPLPPVLAPLVLRGNDIECGSGGGDGLLVVDELPKVLLLKIGVASARALAAGSSEMVL